MKMIRKDLWNEEENAIWSDYHWSMDEVIEQSNELRMAKKGERPDHNAIITAHAEAVETHEACRTKLLAYLKEPTA